MMVMAVKCRHLAKFELHIKACPEGAKLLTNIPALVSAIALYPPKSGRSQNHPKAVVDIAQSQYPIPGLPLILSRFRVWHITNASWQLTPYARRSPLSPPERSTGRMTKGDETEVNDTLNRREADHPRETYQTPANVVSDDDLSSKQKIDILQYWKTDIDARLRAQGEGMGGSDPISAEKEAGLADEMRLLNQAIADLEE